MYWTCEASGLEKYFQNVVAVIHFKEASFTMKAVDGLEVIINHQEHRSASFSPVVGNTAG